MRDVIISLLQYEIILIAIHVGVLIHVMEAAFVNQQLFVCVCVRVRVFML
jgi:hypothetical protein